MRDPHPTAGIEAKLSAAEGEGATVTVGETDKGKYWFIECPCEHGHQGTVHEKDVYAIVVDRTLRRCDSLRGLT